MKHKPVRTEWERALSRASSHKSYHNRKNKSSRPASAADQTGTPPSLIRDLPPHRALPCPRIAPCHAHVRTRTRWLGARGRARAVGESRVPWGRAPSTAGSTRLDLAYRTAGRVRVRTAGRARVRMAGRDAGAWQGAMRGQVSDVKPCALCRGGKRVSAAQCSRQQQARCTSICSHDLTLCPFPDVYHVVSQLPMIVPAPAYAPARAGAVFVDPQWLLWLRYSRLCREFIEVQHYLWLV